MRVIALLITCLMLAGCGTFNKGRVTALDIDCRSEDQIKAYVDEASLPFGGPSEKPMALGAGGVAGPWQWFIDLVSILKGRIRVGTVEWADAAPLYTGGGGGGASGAGGDGSGGAKGVAGLGTTNNISGSPVVYAAGGGSGAYVPPNQKAPDAAANTGDGATGGNTGAAAIDGANGGSGIVILRYTTNQTALAGSTGGTITTNSGYRIHTFTTNGTFTIAIWPEQDVK